MQENKNITSWGKIEEINKKIYESVNATWEATVDFFPKFIETLLVFPIDMNCWFEVNKLCFFSKIKEIIQ